MYVIGTVESFQSTHPVRGATVATSKFGQFLRISIHAPREGCDARHMPTFARPDISIHAPREGCDLVIPEVG